MASAKPKQERKSQISRHPQRLSIELARLAGMSLDRIAAKFGVHRDAVARHMASLDPDYRAALAADVPLEELAERAAKEGGSLLDHLSILRSDLMHAAIVAKSAGDHHAQASLARVALEVSREVGKLTGEILKTPTVTNISQNTLILMSSPFMASLEAMLVRKLAPHPAALFAVQEGLAELQTAHAPVGQVIDAHAA